MIKKCKFLNKNYIAKNSNNQLWLYGHYTDNGEIFYVGAGYISRSFSLRNRNHKHKIIREKYGFNVGILDGPFKSRLDMFQQEINLIQKYHTYTRDKLSNHLACNFSSGGECSSRGANWKLTDIQLQQHKIRMNTPETRKKLSIAQQNRKLRGGFRKGFSLKETTKEKIRIYASTMRPPPSDNTKQKISYTLKIKHLGKVLMSFYLPGDLWNN